MVKESVVVKRVVLNKYYVESAGEGEHRDSRTPGFCLRVTATGKRTFFINAKISGTRTNKTKKIGQFPEVLVDEAREAAVDLLRSLHKGIDPDEVERDRRLIAEREAAARAASEVSLSQAFERYMETKSSKHSVQTKRVYRCEMKHFSDWLELPITAISRSMCEVRFREITQSTQTNNGGPGAANLAFTFLKAVLNFAMFAYELPDGSPLLTLNPVCRINQLGLWNELKERDVVIYEHQFKPLFDILSDTEPMIRDYFMLLLLTGLRRTVASSLPWKNVDMTRRTFKVFDKNGKWHELPMTAYLFDLFSRRRAGNCSDFVFPSRFGDGHLYSTNALLRRISAALEVHVTLHTTRKTFASIAAQILPYGLVKRLMNHSDGKDVTARHYTFISTSQLRAPLETVHEYIFNAAHAVEPILKLVVSS